MRLKTQVKFRRFSRLSVYLAGGIVLTCLIFGAVKLANALHSASIITHGLAVDFSTSAGDSAMTPTYDGADGRATISLTADVIGNGVKHIHFWRNCDSKETGLTALLSACGTDSAGYENRSINQSSLIYSESKDFTYFAGVYHPILYIQRGDAVSDYGIAKFTKIILRPSIQPLKINRSTDQNATPVQSSDGTVIYGEYVSLDWLASGVDPAIAKPCRGFIGSAGTVAGFTDPDFEKAQAAKSPDAGFPLNGNKPFDGGQYTYVLSCSVGEAVSIQNYTFVVTPYIKITADTVGLSAVSATNGNTAVLSNTPLDSVLNFTLSTQGANSCTFGKETGKLYYGSDWQSGGLINTTLYSSLHPTDSDQIHGSTSFVASCRNSSGSSEAYVAVQMKSGSCAFSGDNDVQAYIMCKDSFQMLSGGGNSNFYGSFVAKDFITSGSKNLRFYYDYEKDDNQPPGFRYLNIPTPSDVGNR